MVWDRIGRERGIKIQTIVTLFGRLTERGFLRFERCKGRERAFYPVISRDEYLRMETDNFVDRYHKRSYTSLLNALHRERLTDDDLNELARWVDEARNDTKGR
jgi:predicted transcriptional regulator